MAVTADLVVKFDPQSIQDVTTKIIIIGAVLIAIAGIVFVISRKITK
jgi:hypothetical protein